MIKSKLLDGLNNDQLKAVTYKDGPLLIIAGAGTGKTKVITHRIAWLIEQKLAKPSEILALTFTEKAACEMDERILELMPYGVLDFTATTFHSFCQDLLKEYGIMAGLAGDFKLLSESQQVLFVSQHLDEFDLNIYKPVSNPNKFIGALIKLFSRAKDENVSPEDYLKLAKNYQKKAQKDPDNLELIESSQMILEQAQAYQKYEELKQQYSYYDFGDLITKTLWMLKKRQGLLAQIQQKYRCIFVDEFQDTNFAQAQIAYLLAQKSQNITVVGDDDQSIYKFRGAAISNMLDFVKHYPEAKKVTLTQNYRSGQKILNASYKLITNNNPDRLEVKEKVNKKLVSSNNGKHPEFWHFSDNYDEVAMITKHIISSVEAGKKKFGDFGILIRANSHADDFILSFKEKGIPHHFVGSKGLYDQNEIRELRSYLNVLYNPDDNLSLFHVAWANQFGLDKILLRRLSNLARVKNISLFEIFNQIDAFIEADSDDKKNIKKIINLIKNHLQFANVWSTAKILVDYIHKSGMYRLFSNIESYHQQEILENIKLFFQKISEFDKVSKDKSIFSFSEYLNLIIEAGDNPAVFQADRYDDAVNIMTIHAAKGLEFDTVFTPYLVEGKFPSRARHDLIELPDELIKETIPAGDVHIQEERRLFYVALTRAKNELYLSASNNYANNKQVKKISRFVNESIDNDHVREMIKNKNTDLFDDIVEKKSQPLKEIKEVILSPSNIETFNECPKKFEYSFIFKLSGQVTHSISFGNSIHNTLRDYYKLLTSNSNINDDKIEKIYQGNWEADGYHSKKEMQKAYVKGLVAIKKLVCANQSIPLGVETKFSTIFDNCQLKGRVDKINYDGEYYEIIDYKTGDGLKKTVSEVNNNIPIWIYAIYLSNKYQTENIKLTLHYVMNQKTITVIIDNNKLASKKQEIITLCQKLTGSINHHQFPAQPTEVKCKYCNFKSICSDKFPGA